MSRKKKKSNGISASVALNEAALTVALCVVLVGVFYYFSVYIPQLEKALTIDIEINNKILAGNEIPKTTSKSQQNDVESVISMPQLLQSNKLRTDITYTGLYGRLGGWGSLGLVSSGEAAVNKSIGYAKKVDSWNGSLGVIPVVNLAHRQTSKSKILAAIRLCQSKGCYVMLDISPQENVTSIISTYTIAPNVWFDLDLEHNRGGKVSTSLFNSYVSYYANLRKNRNFSGPGVFAFYDFKSYIAPISSINWINGSVAVVPIFDGFAGKAGKWGGTKSHYNRFPGAQAVGIMEFITRWGSKYDSGFTPAQYYQAFKPRFFMAQ